MRRRLRTFVAWALALAMVLPLPLTTQAKAVIDGVAVAGGVPVAVRATTGHIVTADGGRYLMWGYALGAGEMQFPGPTLIVPQGATVIINLTNDLEVPSSIVFPGQQGVVATGGVPGIQTREAPALGGTVSYSFVAGRPGTYLYRSGTQPELQVEMGLAGTIIVRPTGFNPASPRAYGHADSSYDREYLFFQTEMDPIIHDTIEYEGLAALGATDYLTGSFPVYWFLNGRVFPDTLLPASVPLLPNQPYTSLTLMHPGEKVLLRMLGGGKYEHPFHPHGNNQLVIARNGRLLQSAPGAGADLAFDVFTMHSVPGETMDAIFEWTGKDLGWDIYGTGLEHAHTCTSATCPDSSPIDGFDDVTGAACYDDLTKEYCPDHGKELPVTLPHVREVMLGALYSGSPFMGVKDFLPPDHTSYNLHGGFTFPWHSHAEKELTNFDIFPGGILTFLIIEPYTVTIP